MSLRISMSMCSYTNKSGINEYDWVYVYVNLYVYENVYVNNLIY